MARHTGHNNSKIYAVAEAFRANRLLRNGSLLFDDSSVWRPDVLDKVHKSLFATPDEGERSFIVHFKGQVGNAGPEVVRLPAGPCTAVDPAGRAVQPLESGWR